MAILKLDRFTGIAPRVDPKKLAPGSAQLAENCVFEAGDLRTVPALRFGSWEQFVSGAVTRIHAWRQKWLAFGGDVDVVNSPVVQDQWERIYWSRGPGLSAQFAINNTLQSTTQMTSAGTQLGVSGPTFVPIILPVSVAEPSLAAQGMSQTTPVRATFSTDHPFKNGQRVIVTLAKNPAAGGTIPPTPPDRTGMSEIVGKTLTTREIKNAGTGVVDLRQIDLIGADGVDYSAYEQGKWIATIKRVFTDQDRESRAYVFTLVSQYGEESQPSKPSAVVDVLKDSTVTVQAFVSPEQIANGYRVRLYRSVTGSSGTNFFFVKEVTGLEAASIVDDVDEVSLGELLPSETWAPPPDGLSGLVAMPGGFLVGFTGNTLHCSEPYMPHTFPLQYRQTTQDQIVGLGVYGQTLVIATRGKPYIAAGADPSSLSLQQLDDHAPCISKRCLTSTGTGVIFPSLDGLVHVSNAGVKRLTDLHFTKAQWGELTATQRAAAWHDGRYIAALASGLWLFEPHSEGIHISKALTSEVVTALAVNPTTISNDPVVPADTVYFVSFGQLLAWTGASVLDATWSSGIFTLQRPVSFACAQVYATSYPVTLVVNAASIAAGQTEPQSLVLPNNAERFTVQVNGPEPFRLPADFLAREWRIDIAARHSVQSVYLASSMDELARV